MKCPEFPLTDIIPSPKTNFFACLRTISFWLRLSPGKCNFLLLFKQNSIASSLGYFRLIRSVHIMSASPSDFNLMSSSHAWPFSSSATNAKKLCCERCLVLPTVHWNLMASLTSFTGFTSFSLQIENLKTICTSPLLEYVISDWVAGDVQSKQVFIPKLTFLDMIHRQSRKRNAMPPAWRTVNRERWDVGVAAEVH